MDPSIPDGDRLTAITREARMALSTIRGYAEMLEEELEAAPEAVHRDLRSIQNASERIVQLVGELESHANQAREVAELDPLTGIANRRALFARGARLFESHPQLALVVVDVDEFKGINDRYGHAAGDRVLFAVVERFRGAVRQHDLLARLAGDEFVALLPDADLSAATAVARRLRLAIARRPVSVGAVAVHVTCSIGVAVRQPGHRDLDDLISAADDRMYEAKRHGRDRVAS